MILLGRFNAQGLGDPSNWHCLVRTGDVEYIKVVMVGGVVVGALLVGDTDMEEVWCDEDHGATFWFMYLYRCWKVLLQAALTLATYKLVYWIQKSTWKITLTNRCATMPPAVW